IDPRRSSSSTTAVRPSTASGTTPALDPPGLGRYAPYGRPDRNSRSPIIRSFLLSRGLVMPSEPADKASVPSDTITSVTPRPLTRVDEAVEVSIPRLDKAARLIALDDSK